MFNISKLNLMCPPVPQVPKFIIFLLSFSFLWAEEVSLEEEKPKSPLLVTVSAEQVVVNAEGEEVLQDAENVLPGDTLLITAKYANTSDGFLSDLSPELDIPANTSLIAGSFIPEPTAVKFNDAFFAWPLTEEQLQEFSYASVQSVRWTVRELAPDAAKDFKLRIIVQ